MRKFLALLALCAPALIAQTPVFGPNALQLTPPVFANWSTLGANCTNANGQSFNGLPALVVTDQAATTNTCGLQVAASGTFTRIVVINAVVTAQSFSSVLIGFTDGTKYEACGVGYNNGFAQATAIESATLTGAVSAANGIVSSSYIPATGALFFRLRSVAATSLACDYSPDQGQNWINLFNDTTPFLTVSNVFLGGNQRSGIGSSIGYLLSYR